MLSLYSINEIDLENNYKIPLIQSKLREIIPEEAIEFIASYVTLTASSTRFLETSSRFNVENLDEDKLDFFVNLKRINDIRFLNKFFEAVNHKLNDNAIFIGCAETIEERKRRIMSKYPFLVAYPMYGLDFIVKRIFPKTKITQNIYFFLTRGQNRALSLPEILGRLVSCGFDIVKYTEIKNSLYFSVKKTGQPVYDMQPSYGPVYKMRRIGKDGKIIYVYKLRTMHPYAEYLQEYLYELNGSSTGDKINNDFRVTYWGKFLRKMWLDELPMLINLLKGDIKLVGVRPLRVPKLNIYPEEIKILRNKNKPGLIPPYYADLPKNFDELIMSEKKYLLLYEKNPIKTDIRYFFKVWYNIIIKQARSA